MNLKELKEIIDIVTSKESIEELELEKSGCPAAYQASVQLTVLARSSIASALRLLRRRVAAPPLAAGSTEALQETEEELYYIKSPIVGTFYKAPSPTSEPFVSVGDFVEKGTVVCIIEAMKLMNEIESDVAGEIVSILVENGQPVEYGEKLFAIRPRR